jgi:hypothetical protein
MKHLCILIFSCAASSCGVLYRPNAINTPHLNGKGDFDISALYQIQGKINVNSSYAIKDSLFVFANLSWNDMDEVKDWNYWDYYNHRHLFMDFGFGKKIDHRLPNRYSTWSGGVGYGYANNSNPYHLAYTETNFVKSFLQGNTGRANKSNTIVCGGACRVTHVYNYNLKRVNRGAENTEASRHLFLLEPGGYIALGTAKFKIYYQLVVSLNITDSYFANSSWVNGIGLLFDLKNHKDKKVML